NIDTRATQAGLLNQSHLGAILGSTACTGNATRSSTDHKSMPFRPSRKQVKQEQQQRYIEKKFDSYADYLQHERRRAYRRYHGCSPPPDAGERTTRSKLSRSDAARLRERRKLVEHYDDAIFSHQRTINKLRLKLRREQRQSAKAERRHKDAEMARHVIQDAIARVRRFSICRKMTRCIVASTPVGAQRKAVLKFFGATAKILKRQAVKRIKERQQHIVDFFYDDENSRASAAKHETITGVDRVTGEKEKRQKRYLCDTLKSLHSKYLAEFPERRQISLSTFRRWKPFEVVKPRLCDRPLCMCMQCTNLEYLAKAMHTARLIPCTSLRDLLQLFVCRDDSPACLMRACDDCRTKSPVVNEVAAAKPRVTYEAWRQRTDGRSGVEVVKLIAECQEAAKTADAIAAHLKPVLLFFLNECEDLGVPIRRVSMLSDSPSSQYRSRKMIYIFNRLLLHLDITEWQWLYTEAGHGKGAADGVGAAVKRRCDQIVVSRGNVITPQDVLSAIRSADNPLKVLSWLIEERDIQEFRNILEMLKLSDMRDISKMHHEHHVLVLLLCSGRQSTPHGILALVLVLLLPLPLSLIVNRARDEAVDADAGMDEAVAVEEGVALGVLSPSMRSSKDAAASTSTCRHRGRRLTRKSRRCVSNSNESAQRLLLRRPPSNLPNLREETEETAEPTNKQQNVEVKSVLEVGQSPFDDQLLSSESAEHCGFPCSAANNSDGDDSGCSAPSDSIVQDDKTRNVVLIEGNKAIVVLAHPWPKRPARIPMTEQYKLPNPRLSAAELRRQTRLVRERQEIVDELSRERRRRRFLKGVYCLPKSLLLDSRQRLYRWYSLPTDKLPEDCPAAFEFDLIASNASCAASSVTVSARSDIECAVKCAQAGSSLSYSFINGVCVLFDSADCAASDAASVYRKQLDGVPIPTESSSSAAPGITTSAQIPSFPILSPGYQQQIGGRTFWVFQQRQTGQIAFNRSWDDYVAGFGNATEFWVGLEQIHSYTLAQVSSLRIEIFTAFGEFYVFEWLNFTIGDSGTNYRMNYNSFVSANSTTNCDFLSRARGQQFSTFDKDNDGASYSCCTKYGGGGYWWEACMNSNPNGVYSTETSSSSQMASSCIGGYKALRAMRMMLQG
uniref:Fibrinogen C-terminal domain-containing protein n=1 Tax=Macrostomum lignano TaxID=282301 RepID=A0A1I8I361_9PLAT